VLGLELIQDLEQLSIEWVRLGEASGNIFSSWEWNSLWWLHFGRGRRLLTFAHRDDGRVAAIVPLYGWRERPLRILRFLGHGHGDLLGPVCPGDPKLAADTLRAALERSDFDVFVGDWLLADENWSDQLGGRILRETGYPILRFEARSWDEFLASRTRSFRKDARGEVRKLQREHDVRFRMTGDGASLESDLDTVFHLHRARFGAHEDCYFCGENEAFQREFAAAALERGWLRLWILEVNGRPVSTEYGFRFGRSHFAYQTGREPAWDRSSVGSVLEAHAIRHALEEGAEEYRLLQGNESYKYRYATEDPELEAVGVSGSSLGRIALGATATLRRVKPFASLAKRAAG
jgi:CelD/BcsL family acetyltransferase involved in cellulose biosynthesis